MNKTAMIFLAALCLCSCQFNGSMLRPQKEKHPVKVKVTTVTPSSSICKNVYMGEVVPAKSVILTVPYPGTLKSLKVSKGSIVGGNDIVAVISSQQVESSFQMAKADLEQAKDAMERVQKVFATGSVTQVQMTDIQTKLSKAEAAMEAARHAKDECSLKAPFRGVVSEIFPSEGENLSMKDQVMTILDISNLKLEISIHENEIGAIGRGTKAIVDIPALDISGVSAAVIEKDVFSSKLSHSYKCALKLASTPRGLMPGMVVKVRFESSSDDNRIILPASAVQMDSEGKYVWISTDSCTVEKRRVSLEGYSGKGVIVSDGLQTGDKVITEGYQKVSTGMKVIETDGIED